MEHRASPYQRALGLRLSRLHPALQTYFAGPPHGSVGIGEGVFESFGTRHRWLGPLLAPMRRRGVIVPGMHHDVPFRVENRTIGGRAVAARALRLRTGEWTMCDSVTVNRHGRIVDVLGVPDLVSVSFDLDVEDGMLRMTSRAVGVRIGRVRIRVPRLFAPQVRLTEEYDDAAQTQHVTLTIDLPLLGRVYGYGGRFRYRIEEDA